MSLAQSIRSSTKWLLAGSLGSQLLHFAFGVILARLLLPEDFGLLVTVQIFTGVAGLIAGGGMGQALIRSKEASERDFNVVFTMQFAICVLIYAFFYGIAPYFARWYDEPIYETLLRLTALNFLLRPLVGTHGVWLSRNMRFKVRAIVGFISGLITSISSVYMAWIGMGVWSLALSGLLGALCNWAMLSYQTPLRVRFAFDRATAAQFGGTGVKFSLLDIVSYLRGQINNFVIGRMADPAAVGLFNKAESLAKLPFSTISSSVYQPVFRALAAEQDNKDKSKYIFLRTVTLLLVYTVPAYITFSWLAEPLITVVYGENWTAAAAPLSILAWAWIFSCFNQPAGALLAAQNMLGKELVVQAIALVLNGLACVVGMRWGLAGVAWGLLLARLYTITHMSLLVRNCIHVSRKDVMATLRPGLLVGTATFAGLVLASVMQQTGFLPADRMISLATSLALAGSFFVATLAFAPIPEITSESNRLRQLLRLPKKGDGGH